MNSYICKHLSRKSINFISAIKKRNMSSYIYDAWHTTINMRYKMQPLVEQPLNQDITSWNPYQTDTKRWSYNINHKQDKFLHIFNCECDRSIMQVRKIIISLWLDLLISFCILSMDCSLTINRISCVNDPFKKISFPSLYFRSFLFLFEREFQFLLIYQV